MMQKMGHHPDLGGDESLAQRLNEAVAILCNTESREQYDQWLTAKNSSGSPANPKPENKNTSRNAKGKRSNGSADHTRGCANDTSYREGLGDQIQLPRRKQCPFCHAAYPTNAIGVSGYQKNNRCVQCKGATTPIESISAGSADDIRKIYRHSHQSQAWLHSEWPAETALPATMTDLSIAGCAIHCTKALTLQSVIMLDTQMFNSICQVRYQKLLGPTGLYSIGLEFLTLDIITGPGSVFSATA